MTTFTHEVKMTEDCKKQLNRIAHRGLAALAWGSEPEAVAAIQNALVVINQVIQLGGELTAPPLDSDETMVINGWTGHIAFGVVQHKAILPKAVEEWASGSADMPLCYEYGIHS